MDLLNDRFKYHAQCCKDAVFVVLADDDAVIVACTCADVFNGALRRTVVDLSVELPTRWHPLPRGFHGLNEGFGVVFVLGITSIRHANFSSTCFFVISYG